MIWKDYHDVVTKNYAKRDEEVYKFGSSSESRKGGLS